MSSNINTSMFGYFGTRQGSEAISGEYHAQVSAGPKQVKIESYAATGPVFDGAATLVQVAPAEYNIASTLTSQVKEDADQVIDFNLDRGPKRK